MLMTLDKRLQVLIDGDQLGRLERAARRRKVSVAQVVRDALDLLLPAEGIDRERAARILLEAPPMPVDDWPVLKEEIEGRFDPDA